MRTKTDRLNDRAWDTVGPAFLGACVALIVPTLAMLVCITYPPAPLWLDAIGITLSAAAVTYGGVQWWRWAAAIGNVRAWREERERGQSERAGA